MRKSKDALLPKPILVITEIVEIYSLQKNTHKNWATDSTQVFVKDGEALVRPAFENADDIAWQW